MTATMDGRSAALGAGAWLAVVLIGASWQLATRHGVTATLAPLDLALLRYGVPALLLAPLLCRHGVWPRAGAPWVLPLILLGGGLLFGLLGMVGAQFAPAAHMGALLPGAMPLFVAGLAALVLGERLRRAQAAGFAVIAAGVAAIVAPTLRAGGAELEGAWRGHARFLAAAALWAV